MLIQKKKLNIQQNAIFNDATHAIDYVIQNELKYDDTSKFGASVP